MIRTLAQCSTDPHQLRCDADNLKKHYKWAAYGYVGCTGLLMIGFVSGFSVRSSILIAQASRALLGHA